VDALLGGAEPRGSDRGVAPQRRLLEHRALCPRTDAQYDLLAALGLELPKTLVHLHGEAHAKYRAVTSDWFKPAAVKKLQPAVDSIAEEYAQRLVDFGGCCDFAQDIAVPFTTHSS